MKTLLQPFFMVGVAAVLSACAVGNKHSYHDMQPNLQATSAAYLAVTTHDQREYIVSKDKTPDFVGLQRGGYGNPFDVETKSGNPLASDITQSLVSSFAKKGIKATPVVVSADDNLNAVLDKLKSTGSERFLVLTLIEWKGDTLIHADVIYDIKATVFDRDGKVLAENTLKGKDEIGGSFWNAPGYAKEEIPKAFAKILETLLNNKEITAALQ